MGSEKDRKEDMTQLSAFLTAQCNRMGQKIPSLLAEFPGWSFKLQEPMPRNPSIILELELNPQDRPLYKRSFDFVPQEYAFVRKLLDALIGRENLSCIRRGAQARNILSFEIRVRNSTTLLAPKRKGPPLKSASKD